MIRVNFNNFKSLNGADPRFHTRKNVWVMFGKKNYYLAKEASYACSLYTPANYLHGTSSSIVCPKPVFIKVTIYQRLRL